MAVADPPGRLQRWWLDRSVRAKGLIVVAIPLAALLCTTSANLALMRYVNQERGSAAAATSLANAANAILVDALNAEMGVRGYAVTHNPLFLAPYHLMLSRIDPERRSLHDAAIAEGDIRPEQLVNATLGIRLTELAQLRSAIADGASARELTPLLEAGKKDMDLLRSQITGLAQGPTRAAAAQRVEVVRLEQAISIINIAGLVLGLLAGLTGVALFTSGISRRVRAAAANAGRLGQGQPLEPGSRSGDELGHLADSLVQAEQLVTRRAAELTNVRDEALNATLAKNTFLSRTSHELRTPLNSVLGFAQLLELSDLSDEDHDSAERILGAGRHLLTPSSTSSSTSPASNRVTSPSPSSRSHSFRSPKRSAASWLQSPPNAR